MSRESAESMNEEVITESEFQEAENRASENESLDSSSVSIEAGGDPMLDDPAATEVSEEFVGRWNTLISTTNWEKGRIIGQWRQALIETGAPATCYSDEAWSKRVGGVSSQHVGRLRRVFERFGSSTKLTQGFTGHTFWQPAIGTMPKCGSKVPRRANGAFRKCGNLAGKLWVKILRPSRGMMRQLRVSSTKTSFRWRKWKIRQIAKSETG